MNDMSENQQISNAIRIRNPKIFVWNILNQIINGCEVTKAKDDVLFCKLIHINEKKKSVLRTWILIILNVFC